MWRKIIQDKVDPFVRGIHDSHPFQCLEDLHPSFADVEVSPKFILAEIIKREILSGAERSGIRGWQPLRGTFSAPGSSVDGSDLDRSELIIAYNMGVLRNPFIEPVYAFFFTSNSGSFDSFQVLVRCRRTFCSFRI